MAAKEALLFVWSAMNFRIFFSLHSTSVYSVWIEFDSWAHDAHTLLLLSAQQQKNWCHVNYQNKNPWKKIGNEKRWRILKPGTMGKKWQIQHNFLQFEFCCCMEKKLLSLWICSCFFFWVMEKYLPSKPGQIEYLIFFHW